MKAYIPFISSLMLLLVNLNTGIDKNSGENSSPAGIENKEFRKNFNIAREYFDYGMYKDALKVFKYLLKYDPDNANVNFYVGICYIEMKGSQLDALPYLETAAKQVNVNYRSSYRETQAPVFAYYYLGLLYHVSYDFDKAIHNFMKFRSCLTEKDKNLLNDINHQIDLSENAKQLYNTPVNANINEFQELNTRSTHHYGALYAENEQMLYFNRKRSGQTGTFHSDICYICKTGKNWSRAKSIAWVNSTANDEICYISENGKIMVFASDRDGDYNLYYSEKTNRFKWSKPIKFSEPINSRYDETSACLSAEGNTLIFVSDRKNGYGGKDLYLTKKNNDGHWDTPLNLGPAINTSFDEDFPSLNVNKNILFFSSQGHQTMGGFDIFYSQYHNNQYTTAVNIGYPLNTTHDDIQFVYNDRQEEATFTFRATEDGAAYKVRTAGSISLKLRYPAANNNQPAKNNTSPYSKEDEINYSASVAENQSIYTSNDNNTFTIQVTAGKIEMEYFSRLQGIIPCQGNDGLMRYFIGSFSSRNEAASYLEKVHKLGYPDAWVAPVDAKRTECF